MRAAKIINYKAVKAPAVTYQYKRKLRYSKSSVKEICFGVIASAQQFARGFAFFAGAAAVLFVVLVITAILKAFVIVWLPGISTSR